MDLRLEPSEERFRAELREWLRGVDVPAGLRDYGATPTADDLTPARAWQQVLHRDGWAGLSWPQSHGGRGASPVEQAIFAEEMARAGLPRQLNLVGLELVGPMIIQFGTTEQVERFCPRILSGADVWCQLFSEPGAGSDLASLATSAQRDGDRWRVRGQKVWTSGAHYADFGLLLARTDPDASRHRGISCFLVPMDRPGIDVRPLRQMDGESKFNEVFLDDVEVRDDDLLGRLHDGWGVAMSTLGRERLTLGSQAVALGDALDELRARGRVEDPVARERWTQLWTRVRLLRWTWLRALSSGEGVADPRMSVLKLTASELQRDVSRLGTDLLGVEAVADADHAWARRLLAAPGATLAGGTSEVQRNVLADRVLGLPREQN